MPDLMKLRDLRDALKVSYNTLYRWRKEGLITFVKIAGRNYVTAEGFNAFLENYMNKPMPDFVRERGL